MKTFALFSAVAFLFVIDTKTLAVCFIANTTKILGGTISFLRDYFLLAGVFRVIYFHSKAFFVLNFFVLKQFSL